MALDLIADSTIGLVRGEADRWRYDPQRRRGTRALQPPALVPSRDVAWVELFTRDRHFVGIKTQSDAWLTHTIDARPQPEVHALNSPRLEAALAEAERALGLKLVPEKQTRFANCDGFILSNQVYPDGEVVDCSVLLEP